MHQHDSVIGLNITHMLNATHKHHFGVNQIFCAIRSATTINLALYHTMNACPDIAMAAGCRGLPPKVLQQLLQDIEDHGGLHGAFKLKPLCARKPDVYGLPGTVMRRAVQNKTQRLKKMSRVAYLELLVSLRIESSQMQQRRGTPQHMRMQNQSRGIQPKQLQALLHDIEAHGGIHGVVALQKICNCKPDVYGLPGTKERRVIQNKMHHLKLLNRVEYLELLLTMGIQNSTP